LENLWRRVDVGYLVIVHHLGIGEPYRHPFHRGCVVELFLRNPDAGRVKTALVKHPTIPIRINGYHPLDVSIDAPSRWIDFNDHILAESVRNPTEDIPVVSLVLPLSESFVEVAP
jgi:hypothetical protein